MIYAIVISALAVFALLFISLSGKKSSTPHEAVNDKAAINQIFQIIFWFLKSKEFALYLIDEKNEQFVLKSIYYSNDIIKGNLNVSYSGLVPYKKSKYIFPSSIELGKTGNDLDLHHYDSDLVLSIKVHGGKALIQALLEPRFKLKRNTLSVLEKLTVKLEPLVDEILKERN